MKKILQCLFFVLIGYTNLIAQDSLFVTVKAGYRIRQVLTTDQVFYYPQFTNGKVFFHDGTKGGAKLNYSRLVEQILFVDTNGDTLALDNERTIKFVTINLDTFYYDEGYLRQLSNENDVKFAEKQFWVVADVRKMGTHNRPTTTVQVTTVNFLMDETSASKSKDLVLNEDMVLRKKTHYYFGNKFNEFALATKKNLLTIFPKKQRDIEAYLNANKVNFDSKEDLEKLARYIATVQ